MYPPRDQSLERHTKPSEALISVVCGFAWLALAGFGLLLSHRVFDAVLRVEVAGCFWLQAWATKAGLKKSSRLWIVLGEFSTFLFADYSAGYLRN